MDLDRLLARLELHVEPFAVCQVSTGWGLRLPGPPAVMLHFVLQGRGVIRIPGRADRQLGPCTLAVIPKGAKHRLEVRRVDRVMRWADPVPQPDTEPPLLAAGPEDRERLIVACGLVRVSYGAALGLFDYLQDVLLQDLSDTPRARGLFEDLLAEQRQPGPGSETLTAALMSQCIVLLLRHLCERGDCAVPWLAALEDERLARVLTRIVERPGDPHTVESLAHTAAMSRSTFAESFHRAFGISPMAMVRRTRLEAARRLLRREIDLPLDAVARRVGFSSRSHFSRSFRKEFGLSPSDWRDRE